MKPTEIGLRLRRLATPALCLAALGSAGSVFTAAGCSSTTNDTRIDVTVNVDPALGLDHVAIDIQGAKRPALDKTFAVSATGTPAMVAPVIWQVVVSNLSAPFEAIVTAQGQKMGTSGAVVTAIGGADVVNGQHVAVTLMLTSACKGVACPSGETCSGASCVKIPVSGPSLDGGADGGGGSSTSTDGSRPDRPVDGSGSGGRDGGGTADARGDAGPSKAGVGHICTAASDCSSGYCAQGVCCMTACNDTCYACTYALTGSSPDGTCAVVSSSLADPAGGCTAGSAISCGNTGYCDGNGACEKFGSSTICQAASCGTSGYTSASICDGKGNCTHGTTTGCKGFACVAASGCATACSADGDCPGGYCTSGSTCAASLPDGSACSKNDQCTNANCISGVCCATACSGLCMTCGTGSCKPVAAGGSSAGGCAVDTTACGHDGTCDGNGACRFAVPTVGCGTPACSAGQLTATGNCNGVGACTTPGAAACSGGVVCASGTACKPSTCTADADCTSGLCLSGACAAKRGSGQSCSANDQCTSTFCVDTVCCNVACNGTCQGCNESGAGNTPGTCATISGAPRANHGSCSGSGTCASTCNGTSATCVFPGASMSCRMASCSGGTATLAANCDGAGNCPALSTQGCGQFVCGPTACVSSCSSNSQCVSGAACVNGVCTACTTGQTVCTNACATLASDGANCGACGHSCQGGACSGGTCLPVKLATLPAYAAGLAVNSTTVFTTVPTSNSASWAVYGVAKTATNTTPSPILTLTPGFNNMGYNGASDSQLIAVPFTGGQGGAYNDVISCTPSNCASTEQSWFGAMNSSIVCDPAAQECFVQASGQSAVQYSKMGTASQTSPTSFSPVVNIALSGISAATGGYLYSTGLYSTILTYPVLQRVSEDGTSGVTTLANFSSGTTTNALGGPLVTSTQVYMFGQVNDGVDSPTEGLMSVTLPNGVGNAAPSFLAGTTVPESDWIAYWGDDSGFVFGSTALQWVTCPVSGCSGTPRVLADASQSERYLVGDAQAIYWINDVVDPNTVTVTSAVLMKVAR